MDSRKHPRPRSPLGRPTPPPPGPITPSQQHRQHQQQSSVIKWVALAALVIFLLGSVKIALSSLSPQREQAPPASTSSKPPAPKPVTYWEREYRLRLTYSQHQVTIDSVRVSNLQQKQAAVKIRLRVRTKKPGWVGDPDSYRLGTPSKLATPRGKIRVQKIGGTYHVTLRFRYSTRRLQRGAHLALRLPRGRTRETIATGIEVPQELQRPSQIEERSGARGI